MASRADCSNSVMALINVSVLSSVLVRLSWLGSSTVGCVEGGGMGVEWRILLVRDACEEVFGETADTGKNPAAVRGASSVLSFSTLSFCSVEDLQTDE